MTRSPDRQLSQQRETSRLKCGLTPYSQYVARHGVPWLPPIPSHWSIVSNRIAFQETDETNHPEEAMLSVTIARGVILQSDLSEEPETDHPVTLDRSQYKLVEPDDIVYNKMRAWQGAIGASDYRGLISPDYVVEKPRMGVVSKYTGYLFRTPIFAAEARRWSYGIASDRWRLRHKDFKSIQICLPPADEQAAIVRYLDHADELINRYIIAKERLIALLEEQRQAVIHQAVTRGLDPNAPLTFSGVPWLGDVPAYWELRQLRSILKPVSERNRPDLPLLSVVREKGVILRDIHDDDENHNVIPEDLSNYKVVRPGQFAVNKMKAWQGSYGVSDYRGIVSPAYFVFDVNDINPQFLHRATRSRAYIPSFNRASDGVRIGEWDLSQQQMREITIAVPPAGEQAAIVTHLEHATAETDAAIARSLHQLHLINEYRTRLIADAVTGQIDVSNATASATEL